MYRVHLVKIPGRSTGTWEQKELKKKLFSIFSTSNIFFVYPNIFFVIVQVQRGAEVVGAGWQCALPGHGPRHQGALRRQV